jgi:Nuclease A inhibitor-like protein
MDKPNFQLLDKLHQASWGLLWMSESDYPFEVFTWTREKQEIMNTKVCLEKIAQSPDTLVRVIDIDEFFKVATTEQDWHDTQERKTVEKYRDLVGILKQNLENLQVYLVGEINIDAYIVGLLPWGDWGGLSTKIVQT